MENDQKSPKLSGTAKLDATTEAAYEIIDKVDLERDEKTARLRALRLSKDEADRSDAPVLKTSKSRVRKKA